MIKIKHLQKLNAQFEEFLKDAQLSLIVGNISEEALQYAKKLRFSHLEIKQEFEGLREELIHFPIYKLTVDSTWSFYATNKNILDKDTDADVLFSINDEIICDNCSALSGFHWEDNTSLPIDVAEELDTNVSTATDILKIFKAFDLQEHLNLIYSEEKNTFLDRFLERINSNLKENSSILWESGITSDSDKLFLVLRDSQGNAIEQLFLPNDSFSFKETI